ncbi:hypothetical protein CH63R_01256 [Colletotrichum higginsianum IMI 349063]|uniref:Uncharacterized protein n=1 Tax=Colletotrichum higginsianum (strain IMI 349063) TaxID=759273 RepID=A0A1B7YVK5_COLHI|nr:hypothetical protein CH63R_01256 [Colletotrichum higginsianum IMI 349063]OBR16076.1 hypothetical protein CH63R_01256 [Colletotrichum higginsianum IMI 349063]
MIFGSSPKSLQRWKGNSALPNASVSGGFSINPACALYRLEVQGPILFPTYAETSSPEPDLSTTSLANSKYHTTRPDFHPYLRSPPPPPPPPPPHTHTRTHTRTHAPLLKDPIRHRSLPVASRASTTNTAPGEDIVMSSTAANQGSVNFWAHQTTEPSLSPPGNTGPTCAYFFFFLSVPSPVFFPVALVSSNIGQADVEACRNTTPRAPVLPAQETQDGHSRLHAFESDDQLDARSIHHTGSVERKRGRAQRVNTVIAAVDRLIPSRANGAPAQGRHNNDDQDTDLRGVGAQFSEGVANSDNNSQ